LQVHSLTFFSLQYFQRTSFTNLRTAKITNYLFSSNIILNKNSIFKNIALKSGCKDKYFNFFSPNISFKKKLKFYFALKTSYLQIYSARFFLQVYSLIPTLL